MPINPPNPHDPEKSTPAKLPGVIDQCGEFLKPLFDWAKQSVPGATYFVNYTFTLRNQHEHNPLVTYNGGSVLEYDFSHKDEKGYGQLTNTDDNASSADGKKYEFSITIEENGTVYVHRLLGGKAYLGRAADNFGPGTFNGECLHGHNDVIISGKITNSYGETNDYKITLTQGELRTIK